MLDLKCHVSAERLICRIRKVCSQLCHLCLFWQNVMKQEHRANFSYIDRLCILISYYNMHNNFEILTLPISMKKKLVFQVTRYMYNTGLPADKSKKVSFFAFFCHLRVFSYISFLNLIHCNLGKKWVLTFQWVAGSPDNKITWFFYELNQII